jgi:dTDP-4-amino-4,6-dideoxygalactose transaminase
MTVWESFRMPENWKIHFHVPYLTPDDVDSVAKCLRETRLSQGKYVEDFEKQFAEYVGTKHAIATSNGTTALHTALAAMNVKEGDEVIVPSFSFIATANCVLYQKAKPIFVDVDSRTFNIDPEKIEPRITERTKAIIPVHYGGQPCDMDEINKIARNHNLMILEDSAEAHGSKYRGKMAGNLGDAACFSFYPNKNLTTGEGGMVTTNNDEIARKAKLIRSHGQDSRYHHIMLGYNYRMTDIQASLGISQLRRLNSVVEMKRKLAAYYDDQITRNCKDVSVPLVKNDRTHTYMFYSVCFQSQKHRDHMQLILEKSGIETRIAFPPIHLQPLYQELFGFTSGSLPITEDIANRILSLPIYPMMKKTEQDYIVSILNA